MSYKILDLFAGIGGLASGFKKLKNFNIVLANDYWEPAKDTYKFNNKNTEFILDDIKELTSARLEKYLPLGADIIIGGPPCQGFSMCGTRDINDERNKLFLEYARIVKHMNPSIFILENVKGLLSMTNPEGKSVIDAIYEEFGQLGYKLKHKVVNSKYYGVPQARERVIIVGTSKDYANNYRYPKKEYIDRFVSVGEALNGIPNNNSRNGKLKYEYNLNNEYTRYIKNQNNKIYNHQIANHGKAVKNRMSYVPQGGNWRDIPEKYRVGGIHSNAYRRLENDKPSITIKHAFKSMIIHPDYDRCLTVREVARIQSFKDDFIFKGNKTSQYQQLANAVPPRLSYYLAKSVLNYLKNNNIVPKEERNEINWKQPTLKVQA